ncbi:hypothetical protein FOPE_06516 [Fonsecaea pedrosoi]|nr:hypothetical protein FOPE_06516 [Fonsecaea pedrosoi]
MTGRPQRSNGFIALLQPAGRPPRGYRLDVQLNWRDEQTTIALGIYSSIVLWGALVAILKHIRLQLIFLMSIVLAFIGAMASCTPNSLGRAAVLSVFASFPAGILEIMPSLLVQMETNDTDLGTTFCNDTVCNAPHRRRQIYKPGDDAKGSGSGDSEKNQDLEVWEKEDGADPNKGTAEHVTSIDEDDVSKTTGV